MKYLLVLTVVFVAIWVWRNNRRSERAEAVVAPDPEGHEDHGNDKQVFHAGGQARWRMTSRTKREPA